MKIIFHGAAQEVGKSCIEIQTNGKRYIMDAGIKFSSHGNQYPKDLEKIFSLDGVFISHAHLDHSGALPLLEHKKLNCPIYLTKLTWKTTNMLLSDSYHLEKLKHLHPAYVERDIKAIERDLRFVQYDKEYKTPDGKITFSYINSGHIPGGASIIMNIEGKTLVYTADINTEPTQLMVESELHKYSNIDILITENTYGDREHPDRKIVEKEFLETIQECIKNGGNAIIPVFGVGRSQEILILLHQLDKNIPIVLDGMSRKLTKYYIESSDPYIKNKDKLQEVYERCHIVQNGKERPEIAKKTGQIIVSTSGMVQGGPIVSYIEHMLHDSKNYIILTGYQGKGTNGRTLLEDRVFWSHHQQFPVKAQIKKFDFSAHYGQKAIRELICKIKPKNLILQHGDPEALCETRAFAHENLPNTNVFLPACGDIIEITDEKSTIKYKEAFKEKNFDKCNICEEKEKN
jgi:putative mRNA 3-end processing factor